MFDPGFGDPRKAHQRHIEENQRVYFIREGVDGPIKIGVAINVNKRRGEVQVHNSNPVAIMGSIPGGVKMETFLHKKFSHLHKHGEWFYPGEDLLAEIEYLLSIAPK